MNERRKRTTNKLKNSKLSELAQESYIGIIEDIDDPKFEGRCKIRVFGIFGDKNDSLGSIPLKDIPWAYPLYDLQFGSSDGGSGRFSTPKPGTKVRVVFDGDQYHPRYFSIEELDAELKSLLEADYVDFQSVVYDSGEQLKIYYAKNTGLLIELKQSIINIEPGGAMIIQHSGSSAIIELRGNDIDIVTNNSVNISTPNTITLNSNLVHANGATTDLGASPIYSAVNGEIMMKLFMALATGLDAKFPVTPSQFANLVKQMEPFILSKTVNTTP